MKNQYFGDVNDYLKYGLLRCFAEAGFRLGVCWMLTPDDGGRDGRKLGYLSKPEQWRHHDAHLFDALHHAVSIEDRRNVAEVSKFFGLADFWEEHVPEPVNARDSWLHGALTVLAQADIIFFDPDNGLEVSSLAAKSRKSSKHVYWHEIEEAWTHGSSLLVFQYFARENRDTHVRRLTDEMARRLPGATIVPLRTSHVLFMLATQPLHESRAETALDLVRRRWHNRIT